MTEAPALLDVLRLRAWARAHLYAEGELDLLDAVDALQSAAEHYGLVAELGQDAIQQIIADAFRPVHEALGDFDAVPDESPDFDQYEGLTGTFRAACVEADRAIAERKRNAPEPAPMSPHAAASTVDALAYSLRTHGTAALRDPDNQRRLAELSVAQIEALIVRLARVREQYTAIDDEALILVAELLP